MGRIKDERTSVVAIVVSQLGSYYVVFLLVPFAHSFLWDLCMSAGMTELQNFLKCNSLQSEPST
jgi:hypothetical protein